MTKCLHIYLSYGKRREGATIRRILGWLSLTHSHTLHSSPLKRAADLTSVCFPFDVKGPHVRVINLYLINFWIFEAQVGITGKQRQRFPAAEGEGQRTKDEQNPKEGENEAVISKWLPVYNEHIMFHIELTGLSRQFSSSNCSRPLSCPCPAISQR